MVEKVLISTTELLIVLDERFLQGHDLPTIGA